MRLTKWEGRGENGPCAVLVRNERTWLENMNDAMKKLALYEDMEEREGRVLSLQGDTGNE
jgi:hypothetical protein